MSGPPPLPSNLIKPKHKKSKKIKLEDEIKQLQIQFEKIDVKEKYRKNRKMEEKRADIEAELSNKKEKLKKMKKKKPKTDKQIRKDVKKEIDRIAKLKRAKHEKILAGIEKPGPAYKGQPRVSPEERKAAEDMILYHAIRKLRIKNIKLN